MSTSNAFASSILSLFVVLSLPIATGAQSPDKQAKETLEGTRAGDVRESAIPSLASLTFVWCPPGQFTIGSPKDERARGIDEKQVSVTLSHGFWLGRTEVTQGQWQALMETQPWKDKDLVKLGDEIAATWVSHQDATDYCRKLTENERREGRLPTDWEYVLPTESQWEYACRAGTTTRYHFGDDESILEEYAWFNKSPLIKNEKFAHTVATKLANAWGLHDMHGNVWEWCRDWQGTRRGGTDPLGPEFGAGRTVRGGSWGSPAWQCRSANRGGITPKGQNSDLGFRLSLAPVSK